MNKTQKKEKCKEILKKTSNGIEITELEDIKFLIGVFENHSEWDVKKGSGINKISVNRTEPYNTKCFFIHRTDGSITDISYKHCLQPLTKLAYIKMACRSAVSEIIINYRDNVEFGLVCCPFTDELLTLKNTQIDHHNLTFAELFNKWIVDKDVDILYEKLNTTKDEISSTYFTDLNIVNDFISFHNANTHLRAVSIEANRMLSKLNYIK
jgi:hypothetical protein